MHSEGFEPPALGIEIRCSIQLSYECDGGTIAVKVAKASPGGDYRPVFRRNIPGPDAWSRQLWAAYLPNHSGGPHEGLFQRDISTRYDFGDGHGARRRRDDAAASRAEHEVQSIAESILRTAKEGERDPAMLQTIAPVELQITRRG
ncbi:MAG: hypothetical protein JWQ24_5427 [Tardiphaga sp.]|nr:hypothetical protein [Tardiphaga sp.]